MTATHPSPRDRTELTEASAFLCSLPSPPAPAVPQRPAQTVSRTFSSSAMSETPNYGNDGVADYTYHVGDDPEDDGERKSVFKLKDPIDVHSLLRPGGGGVIFEPEMDESLREGAQSDRNYLTGENDGEDVEKMMQRWNAIDCLLILECLAQTDTLIAGFMALILTTAQGPRKMRMTRTSHHLKEGPKE